MRNRLVLLSLLGLGLSVGAVAKSEGDDDPLRPPAIDRMADGFTSTSTWLSERAFGLRPLDATLIFKPWRLLIVEFDITRIASDEQIPALFDLFERYDSRLRILMVDQSEIDLDELEWRVWQQGWSGAPVAWTAESPTGVGGDLELPRCAWIDTGADFNAQFGNVGVSQQEVRWAFDGADPKGLRVALDEEFERLEKLPDVYEEFAEAWIKLDFDDLEEALSDWGHALRHSTNWDVGSGSWANHNRAEHRYKEALLQRRVDIELLLLGGRTVEAEKLIPSVFGRVLEKKDHKKRGFWVTHYGIDAATYKDGAKLHKLLGSAERKGLGAVKEKLEQFVERASDSTPKMRAQRYLRLIERFGPK